MSNICKFECILYSFTFLFQSYDFLFNVTKDVTPALLALGLVEEDKNTLHLVGSQPCSQTRPFQERLQRVRVGFLRSPSLCLQNSPRSSTSPSFLSPGCIYSAPWSEVILEEI